MVKRYHRLTRMEQKFPILLLLAASFACGPKDEKGVSIGMPAVKPPVERNTPSGMKDSASLNLMQNVTPLATIGSRLFTSGPTSVMEHLAQIDSRLAELDSRAIESVDPAECLEQKARAWTLPAPLPAATPFPIYLQCYEEFAGQAGDSLQIAFGFKDDYAYLVEIQSGSSPQRASLVRTKKDGSSTEAWITMQKFDSSATASNNDYFFLALKADDTSKTFEVAVGGSSKSIGVDCGVRARANGAHIFGSGIFASYMDRGVETCRGFGNGTGAQSSPKLSVCVDAATLQAADPVNCSVLSDFNLPELTHKGLGAAEGKLLSDAFINTKITGLKKFTLKD